MKKVLLLFPICFFAIAAVGQPTDLSYNHLLWRISGKGLDRSSYLFGTMHLADKQLFYFGDSLYAALEHTDGFATELDMDGAFSAYFSFLQGDKKTGSRFLQEADAEAVTKYRVQLEKQIGKKSDLITLDDVQKEVALKRKSIAGRDHMETFLDAYLFDLAARMGKWTGGVEDFQDQFSLLDQIDRENISIAASSDEGYREMMTRLKSWYIDERLDLIGGAAYGGFADAVDPSMVKRNNKMAYRMDSLAHERSTVFAVGAAHLPGDSGVISLLRRRGFRVEPVVSSRRIAPGKYVFHEVAKRWHLVVADDSTYSVNMPQIPMDLQWPDFELFKLKINVEMGNQLLFFTGTVPADIASVEVRNNTMQQMVTNFKKLDGSLGSSPIVRDSIPGLALQFVSNGMQFYGELFVPGDYIVINAVGVLLDNSKKSVQDEIERFFDSFKPIVRKDFSIASPHVASRLDVPDYSFSIAMPESRTVKRVINEDSTATTFNAMAMANGNQSFLMIEARKPRRGYQLLFRDSLELIAGQKSIQKKMNSTDFRQVIERDGSSFKSMSWTKGAYESQEMVMKTYVFRNGELGYAIVKTTADLSDTLLQDDDFFQSFRRIPFSMENWNWQVSPDGSFETFAPVSFSIYKSETDKKGQIWLSQDTISAVNYFVEKYAVPRYFSGSSDTALLNNEFMRQQNRGDEVLSSECFRQGAASGLDAVVRSNKGRYQCYRIVLSGDTIFLAHAAVEPEQFADTSYARPIRDLRLTHPQLPAARLFVSHVDSLIAALKSPDSLVRVEALETLGVIKFKQQDVPVLQDALLWAAETDLDFGYIWPVSYIRKAILNADTARSSISFVRNRYQQLPSSATASRGELLSLLASQQTTEAFDLLAILTRDSIPSALNTYFGFYDSLKLTGKLFPGWVRYLDDPGQGVSVTVLLSYLVKEKMVDSVLLRGASNDILAIAASQLSIARRSVDSATTSLVSMVDILNSLQTPDSRRMIRSYGDLQDPYVKLAVVKSLVSQNEPVGLQILLAVAKDFRTRKDLYDFLKDNKKANLFPAAYKTAKWMGESELANWLDEDDYEVDSISWIAERVVNIGDKRQKIQLYKVTIVDDEGVYLGIAGPYDLTGKLLEPDRELVVTGVYFDEELDMNNLDEAVQTYLKQFDE